MRFHHIIQHMANHKIKENKKKGKPAVIEWWQLSLIGIGSIMGAGFFLGAGLSIKTAGPSVIIGYFLAGIAAFFTFAALAEMTVNDPEKGSFRTYAKKAYGDMFGFISGWGYWFSGVLIMSSEITALSTFAQYWFHSIPLWIFSIIFSCLGIFVILLGVSDFGKIESLFAVIKLATLVIIIIFGALVIFGWTPSALHTAAHIHSPFYNGIFTNGFFGFFTGILFVLFSFGGIGVVGVTASQLRNKSDVPKAGYVLVISLTGVYILSLLVVLSLAKWTAINESKSPFLTALGSLNIPFLGTIFNIIIITASFSTMVGALYSITNILVSLAKDHDAPEILGKTNKRGVPIAGLVLTACILAVIIVLSYFLPKSVYEYLTTAASVMLLFNWMAINLSEWKNRKSYHGDKFKMPLHPFSNIITLMIIVFAIVGGLFTAKERIGVLVAIGIIVIITIVSWIYHRILAGGLQKGKQPQPNS
ncbi:amino acid permease [Scopulibacillus cellulosilyticus]|uniref:Amino acid permease n=1 Tax=Scopulibacillus cellulosilyticus TaxID=2665665 RepID=A0ABW2Q715_9BACL